MHFTKNITGIFCALIMIGAINSVCTGKSVFVIPSIGDTEIWAYKIDGSSLTYQTSADITYSSPVGIAVHESDYGRWLFCSFEGSNKIEIINAQTMTSENAITVSNASNIAGIVVDNKKNKLYAVNRYRNRLWSYSWNPATNTLAPDFNDPYYVTLEGLEWDPNDYIGAFGIALDEENDLLYVADNNDTIEYYNTNDWSMAGEVNVPCNAISVAIDSGKQLLYFGSITGYGDGDPCLYQYNLLTDEVNSMNVGGAVSGIAVDQQTSIVYVTTYSSSRKLLAYDANLVQFGASISLSRPTGLVVAQIGYKSPCFSLVKDNNEVDCVEPLISQLEHEWIGTPYNWLYYNINWDANGFADSNVVITDYLPSEVNEPNFISSGGIYDSNSHTVTWVLDSIDANSSGIFKIQVGVNNYAMPASTITNKVIMEGDTYCNQSIIDTNVCLYGGEIIYVDADANSVYHNGTSWDYAFVSLQDGLTAAENCGSSITAIWVAAGTYKPVESTSVTSYQSKTFTLSDNLALIGHFGGIGTYETSADQRVLDDANNATILDGRIGTTRSLAVYNIITATGISNAIIDGFTIRNSYGGSYPGAVYLNNSDVSILNCRFEDNYQYGIYAYLYSYPYIYNCTFFNNTTAGCYTVSHCEPVVLYCEFDGNDVGIYGLSLSSYNAVTIENCQFNNHTAYGICGSGSTLSIANSGVEYGKYGIYLSDVTVGMENCTIKSSTQYGLFISDSSAILKNITITDSTRYGLYATGSSLELGNSVISGSSQYGVYIADNPSATIENSVVKNNLYSGIYANDSDFSISQCLVSGNSQNGIYAIGGCNPDITNSVIRRNGYNGLRLADCPTISVKNSWINKNGTAYSMSNGCSGIYLENASATPVLRNNTIYDNRTYGVQANLYGPDPNVQNCIVYGNDVNDFYRATGGDAFDAIRYSCLQHLHSGTGNFVADPMFMNSTDANNLHIDSDSSCVDAGDPCGVYAGETDIDGETRNNGCVDIGGDETYWSYADFDENGIVNFLDYYYLAQDWRASESDYSLDDDNDIDVYDLSLFCTDWLWQNQTSWLDSIETSLQSSDIEGLQVESLSLSASSVSFESESATTSSDSLMIMDLDTSRALMPKKLARKVNSFYAITPQSVAQWKAKAANLQRAEQATFSELAEVPEAVDVNSLLDWLEDLWQNDEEIRNSMTEEEYLEFRNSIEESE